MAVGQGFVLPALATRRAAPFCRALGYQESAVHPRKMRRAKQRSNRPVRGIMRMGPGGCRLCLAGSERGIVT